MIFDVTLRLTRRELEASFDPGASGGEHTSVEYLYDDPDAAIPSLDRIDQLTPVAEAAYLLHVRAYWGSDWFDQICLLRYGALATPTQFPTNHSIAGR